jgi:Flp pilus assembly protein TadG
MGGLLRRAERGQEVVEFALILPLLMTLLFGIVEFGWAVFSYNTIANAAREGARWGIVHPYDDAGIMAKAKGLTAGLNRDEVTVEIRPDPASRLSTRKIEVEVSYEHPLITGWIWQVVGGSGTLDLYSVATMRIEFFG